MARLRCAYFAQAAESAARYGVSFDRLVLHLWSARRANRRLLVGSIAYVDDLVQAVACVDGVGLAWIDLAERYERALMRHGCGGPQDVESIMLVRRMFAELRRRNAEPHRTHAPSLRVYTGSQALRHWLADRMNAVRIQAAVASGQWKSALRIRLALAVPKPRLPGNKWSTTGTGATAVLRFALPSDPNSDFHADPMSSALALD